jgi:hypothetical protein
VQENVPEQITKCTFCKLVMGTIDTLLSLNATDTVILTEIEKLCPIQIWY